jgi:hypothetical protein
VLHPVEEAFDDVAVLVVLDVVADGPAAGAAFALTVGDLVRALRDDGLDAAGAEQLAVGSGGLRLVCAQGRRRRARASGPAPCDLHLTQQQRQHRAIPGLAGSDDQREESTESVDESVALGAQPTSGPADGVIVRFVPADCRILVIPQSPLCATTAPTSTSLRSRRADASARWWSRSRYASRRHRRHQHRRSARPAPGPACRSWTRC